jgi:hypothetical protein
MEKIYVLGIALLLVAIFAVAALPGIQMSAQDQGLQYHSSVCIYKNNELVDCSSNLLYDSGKDLIKTALGDTGSGDPVQNITLCNATAGCGVPVAGGGETYNEYTSCGLTAGNGAYNSIGTGNWSISKVFTASCDNLQTNVTRLKNANGVTNFAGNNFTMVTLQTNDQINVTWTIWVT